MASTDQENYLKQVQNRTRQFLDTNNSLTSKTSDEIFSLLEAGEGSFYLRDHLDNILHDMIRGAAATNTSINYNWTTLRQLMNIKDKIAYITAVQHTNTNATANPSDLIVDENHIKETLNTIISQLDQRLINDQEFTESWILRHAAINRFSCKVKDWDRTKLNSFAHKIKDLCSQEWFDILAESVHFTFESDAQKIIKVDEVIKQLSAMWVVISDDIMSDFDKFGEYIKPLRELDKAYKHLSNTLNMVHETAKTTDKSMISPSQKQKVDEVLNKLDLKKTVEENIINFNKEENLWKNQEHWIPMKLLKTIKSSLNFQKVAYESGIENSFDHLFLSWVTFELTHWAHSLLTKKKAEAFGADEKKYNEDTNSRRWMMRRRIFEVYDRTWNANPSSEWNFANDQDFELMNSYYTKFPNLFFNSPADNYNVVEWQNPADVCARHFDKMRSILAAIIRRRIPALRSSDRLKRWSYPQIIVDRARHSLKWDERWIFNWIERQIKHTDDASIIAMTIMLQNQANNKLFYEEKDPFEVKSKWYSKIFKKVAWAERWRQAVRDKFGPATNFALKATETTAKWAIWATAWTLQKWAKMVNVPLEKINEWLSKRSNRNPIKLWMIATKPMNWLLNPLSKWIKTGKDDERITISQALSKWYKAWTEALPPKKWWEKKTKYLYQWLTRGLESVTKFFWETVADSGQWMQDQYTVASQRSVLWALYNVAQKEDRWKDLMRSSDLANMLDLRNIWPKLFDDDGRILPVDKSEKEIKEENFDKEAKAIEEHLKKQIQLIEAQSNDKLMKYKEQLDSLYQNTWDNSTNIERLQTLIEIEDIINKDVDKVTSHINLIVSEITKSKKDISILDLTAVMDNLTNEVGWAKLWLIKNYEKSKKNAESEIEKKESEIQNTKNEIKKQQDIMDDVKSNKNYHKDAWLMSSYNNALNEKSNKEQYLIKKNHELKTAEKKRTSAIIALSRLWKIKSFAEKIKKISDQMNSAITISEKKKLIKELSEYISNSDILREKITKSEIVWKAKDGLSNAMAA